MNKLHFRILALFFFCILVAGLILSLIPGNGILGSVPYSAVTPKILSTVPDVRQSQPYSCGASSLQAVLSYWGTDVRESVLMDQLNTSPETGTAPLAIVRVVAQDYGLDAEFVTNMTLEDLKHYADRNTTVIIDCQAGRDSSSPPDREADWENRHYMVVIGLDDANVYFEDPSTPGSRGMVPRAEFVSRWHDYPGTPPFGPGSVVLNHDGIIIQGNTPAQFPGFIPVE